MRLLLLSQFYPPIIGGEERHTRDLAVLLAARGHAVAVGTIWHAGLPEFEVDQGVRVHRIRGTAQRAPGLFSEATRFHAPSFPDPELTLGLRRVVQQERPDIVHAHNWLVYSFLPLKTWSQAKLILSVHDASVRCATKKLSYRGEHCAGPGLFKCLDCARSHYGLPKGPPIVLTNWLMGYAERAAVDAFIPVSRAVAAANNLLDQGLNVKVIPNFVRDDIAAVRAEPHPKLHELPVGEFMLYVGALGRYKGLNELFRAYDELDNPPPLVVIGYTIPESPVDTTNLPRGITVLRNWPHEAVMQAWQRCLFGLVPSTSFDSCPTTTIEAMAVGRPVIGTRIGGIPDQIVDGETGFLVPPGDVAALKHAMERLLADPALRARMGHAAKRKAVEFQASTVVDRIEQTYRELLTSSDLAQENIAASNAVELV
ncbi:MAG: glycosyltransferase family 4 protein [Chloroflexi bacterium]|nr:glycosyltransferase family 4 protein [Chloroflexota bacterium]